MKHEWKKHEKNLYGVKQSPRIVDIPMQQFIMIKGEGNPNDKEFSDKVSALYSLAYGIKMMYKNTMISLMTFFLMYLLRIILLIIFQKDG